jgi:large-conductance mechanosensitive channel
LTVALNFLIIAWVLFLAIRGINKLKKDLLRPPGLPQKKSCSPKFATC